MFGTIAFLSLSVCYVLFLLYLLLKPQKFNRRKLSLVIPVTALLLFAIFMLVGSAKVKSDLARIFHNTGPKAPGEIYRLIFKKPIDSSILIVKLKDQVIPLIDCCIWMQLKIEPNELNRILHLRKYEQSFYLQSDSIVLLQPFNDNPAWWRPQSIADTIIKASFQFSNGNEQILFFAKDSSNVFVCDKAP